MMKLALPILLASVVMIAGIFAFTPVYEASTVHTTIQSTVQNTQFNQVKSTFDTDLSSNATASCSAGSFLVFYTYSNRTANPHTNATLGIDVRDAPVGIDLLVRLSGGNETVSGIVAGSAGESMNFSGMRTDTAVAEDSGQLSLTIQCRSTATPTLTP